MNVKTCVIAQKAVSHSFMARVPHMCTLEHVSFIRGSISMLMAMVDGHVTPALMVLAVKRLLKAQLMHHQKQ